MAALTLFIFSLLVSTTFAIEDLENTRVVEKEEERPAFQSLPLQLGAPGERKEFYFHVFFHEEFDGKNKTTQTVVSPNGDVYPEFGKTVIRDVPLWDTVEQGKLIARVQGAAFQSDKTTYGWHNSFGIEFEMTELKGSTLQVMGRELEITTTMEWAIVGGTGKLTMAQGVIYGRRRSSPDETVWIELKMYGYYTPMAEPKW